ncbi:MAG: YraN family protein [Chitinophagales bacterium]|nr:YraN family protein [Chitinophagales bacterium]
MANNIGDKGEKLALDYLKNKNYQILATNWRSSHKEIDIIAKDEDILVIVEVKTRGTDSFGQPSDFVDQKKHNHLYHATQDYIYQKDYSGEVRFDIISIVKNESKWDIDHIEDAFYPG